jgi:branched-chain amino acid transport system ATP-binding protein
VERQNQLAGTMSGGERKMLAIGRGLMSDPELLLVDEPSFGLAPQLTESVFESLNALKKRGMTIMLVEQNVTKALAVTDRGYVLENGRIELEGRSRELACNDHVRKVFLGV